MLNIDFYTNVIRLGNSICVRGISNGREVSFKTQYSPTLYIENEKDLGFKSIYGKNLKPISFDSLKESYDFTSQHKDSNLNIYGFPYYHSQFILENYSDTVDKFDKSYIRTYNIDIEVTSNSGFPKPNEADYPITAVCIYDSVSDVFFTLGIGEWDISNSILPPEVSDKVRYLECKDEVDLLSKMMHYWKSFPPNIVTGWNVEGFDILYIARRLEKLGFDVKNLSPWRKVSFRDIRVNNEETSAVDIAGVEVIDYMLLYKKNKTKDSYRLDNIAQIELGEKKSLGTIEMLDMSRTPFVDTPSNNVYDLSDDEEFNRFAKVRKERIDIQNSNNPNKDLERQILIKEEKKWAFQAFISYNIQDVNLVKRLDEKMGLLDAQIMIAYEACMNFGEVSSPVRTWDCLINKEMHRNNQIPPFHINRNDAGESIPGGFVKTPQIGKHGWVVSFDLNSLYPHLIMQFNISPETLDEQYRLWPFKSEDERVQDILHQVSPLEDEHLGEYSVSAAGYRFKNDFEGIIPRLMRKMYQDRKGFKKKMIEKQKRGEDDSIENLRQYVLKILLNSGYGALINKYFRWFDIRMGKAITLSGQMLIQTAEKSINEWMNKVLQTNNVDYIIAIDTDSNYVNFQPLVDKFFSNKSDEEIVEMIDKISQEQVQSVLDNAFQKSADYTNAIEQKMVMEREAIASKAFWTAKKRYAMAVHDLEGVRFPIDKPKMKIQGLEAIRSSTPYVCREPLLDIINLTLLSDEENVQEYIANFKSKFMEFPPEDIAMPRSMNNLQKYYQEDGFMKGTPPQTRGAIQFNKLILKHDLQNSWEQIREGEKGKFLYLTVPNNTGNDTLSFITKIPEEFACNKYIDRNKMFEKTITEPVRLILESIGWSVEKRITLDSFFG